MGNGDFIDVTIKARTSTTTVKIEKGCTFETKSKKFSVGSNGKLSIFDKNTKTTSVSDTITITDYQKQAFVAVANNNDDKTGKLTLSIEDIKIALGLNTKNKLEKRQEDLCKDLGMVIAGNYEVKNPRIFDNENKLSAYIFNGNEKTSGIIAFQFKEVKGTEANPALKPEEQTPSQTQDFPAIKTEGAFLGEGLFNNKNVVECQPTVHTVKEGEDILSLAKEYQVDSYQIIAANPQLKEGVDYKVTYGTGGAEVESQLKPGQEIQIPARYLIKKGSMKTVSDIAKVANVSEEYVKFLMVQEPFVPNNPDLDAYDDQNPRKKLKTGDVVKGTLTVGYGHTGRVYGDKIKIGTKITKQQAMDLLAEDIMKHKAMTMAYIGRETFEKAPKSVQATILDITYNKGIWNGFMDDKYCEQTKFIKKDMEQGNYVAALVHSRRVNTSFTGLKTRNVYKFIMGLTDLTPEKRKAAIKGFELYYNYVYKSLAKGDKPYLKKAWDNAKNGKTTNIKMRYGQ